MARIALALAATALTLIENGLREGRDVDVGILASITAGLGAINDRGMEPTDNEVTAIQNLLDLLVAPAVAPEPPSVPVPLPLPTGAEGVDTSAAEGVDTRPSPDLEPASPPVPDPVEAEAAGAEEAQASAPAESEPAEGQ